MSAEVKGQCPACGWRSLFLGSGGYVTCSQFDCPDPCSASDMLDKARAVSGVIAAARAVAEVPA